MGGSKTITTDFRLIAATNRNLKDEVDAGRFREDLYYRLNVIPLSIPPLRKRLDDISMLADSFLVRYSDKYNKTKYDLTPDDLASLTDYHWPGNIRELKNVMERSALLFSDDSYSLDSNISSEKKSQKPQLTEGGPTLEEVQRRYISYVLEQTKGKYTGPDGACQILGIKPSTLYNRMKKLKMR